MPDTSNSKVTLVTACFLIVVGVVIYSNSFSVPFHFDDFLHITEKPKTLESWQSVWEHYSHTRFLTHASLALNYRLGKENVFGYHAVNVAIHILNAIWLFMLVRALLDLPAKEKHGADPPSSWPLAAVSAFIFLAHPLQTQAVTYIIQRASSLATFFYLLAMLSYTRARIASLKQKPVVWWRSGALLATVLAMFCKETAFTLPIALLLIEMFFFIRLATFRSAFLWLLPFLVCLCIIPLTMWMQIDGAEWNDIEKMTAETTSISRGQYLLTQFHVICTYLRLLLVPIGQNLDYDYPLATTLWNGSTLLCLSLLVVIAASAVWLFRRHRLASFAIFLFFLTLSVESSIVPIFDVIFEHRLYLPCIAFATLMSLSLAGMAGLVCRRRPYGVIFLTIVVAYMLVLATLTWRRNEVWRTRVGLWQDTVQQSPRKARPHINLGVAYHYEQQYEQAVRCYRQAIALEPRFVKAYNNLGVTLRHLRRYDEAIQEHLKALRLRPDDAEAMANLGLLYRLTGRLDESVAILQQAIQRRPDMAAGHYYLGLTCEQLEQYGPALVHYRNALRFIDIPEAYLHVGNIHYRLGQYEDALVAFRQAVRYNPQMVAAHYNLGLIYSLRQLWPQAIDAWQQVLRIEPTHSEAALRLQELENMGIATHDLHSQND